MSGPQNLTDSAQAPNGVGCAKCGQVNARGRNLCQTCGAHLYVACHHCGHRNDRTRPRCVECEHKLHRSWRKQAARRLFGKERDVSRMQIALLLLAILLGIGVIKFFAELQLPEAGP